MQKIVRATKEYEAWVETSISLSSADLEYKHEQMRSSSFAFLRATFYRWAQVFAHVCPDLAEAPKVLAVGDLHAENFGTWRDAEGRLVWGVNDFDEVAWLPYTVDLVRLAVSIELADEADHLRLDPGEACEALLEGYLKSLESGGEPFVLAERHGGLRRMATGELRNPVSFWDKIEALPQLEEIMFDDGKLALLKALPHPEVPFELKSRRAGLGSLGRPRYLACADFRGGRIAREAKALCPSGAIWAGMADGADDLLYPEILRRAVRCLDPFVSLDRIWLVRRLAPDCSRIELSQLPAERDEERLIEAMGFETGNIHLGSKDVVPEVLSHLESLPRKWLKRACAAMAEQVRADFKDYCEA